MINYLSLVTKYLLFIDTEASGLPKRWDVPYSKEGNWSYAVQIAWSIFTREGIEVKQENHYIKDDDFEISLAAKEIHGVTREFLNANGEERKQVMPLLADDLHCYQPLVVGHFIEFDFYIAGAEFYRTGIDNPIQKLDSFCIMMATKHMVVNPAKKYLRLGELYKHLFKRNLQNEHDAIVDAKATAECFFELLKRGEITEGKIDRQKMMLQNPVGTSANSGCSMFILLTIMILLIMTILL